MADDPNPSDPVEVAISAASAAGRKRPPPTLDLTATDTTPEANPPPPDAVTESPAEADTVAPEPFAAGDQLPPPPTSGSVPPNRSSFGGAFAAGALGAVLMLVALGMLWVAGLFGGDTSLLTDRTNRLETQLRGLTERPAPTTAPAFDSGKLDDLTKRLATLESAKPASPGAPDAALTGRITSLESTIKTLSGRLDATANTARETAAAQSQTPAATPAELEALTARVSTVERAAKAIQDDVAKRFAAGLTDPAARRAVTAEALRVAVERGEPFAAQLKAAQPLAGNNTLAALRPFADAGVPTTAALARELNTLLPALRSAQPSAPNTDSGFMQKLASNAEKLVRVRPVNETAGDDPAATLSRIEARAQNADIDGALTELAKLPTDSRAPAAVWMQKAQARRDAVQAARQFAADSLNQLAPDSSGTR
ncbi:MAG: hypothetical protein JWN71_3015 [Xanthobacteraceae bacterium]|nr:hypothetical protein [Xanthobacteraceae bacterium]